MQVTPIQMDGTMQGEFLGTGTESSLSYTARRVMVLSQPDSIFPQKFLHMMQELVQSG